jgi:hypothetical protein
MAEKSRQQFVKQVPFLLRPFLHEKVLQRLRNTNQQRPILTAINTNEADDIHAAGIQNFGVL